MMLSFIIDICIVMPYSLLVDVILCSPVLYVCLPSFQVPKEKRLLPVAKVVEITEEQEKRSVCFMADGNISRHTTLS